MINNLQLTILITLLVFVTCGIISTYIFQNVAKSMTGRQINEHVYLSTLIFIILGPIALFIALGTFFLKKILGRCVDGNCLDGEGTKVYRSGDKYIGQWNKGQRNGKGTYCFADGKIINGQWKDGDYMGNRDDGEYDKV